jgi:hypothetical protein
MVVKIHSVYRQGGIKGEGALLRLDPASPHSVRKSHLVTIFSSRSLGKSDEVKYLFNSQVSQEFS